MATALVARSAARAIPRSTPTTSSIRVAARSSRQNAAREFFQSTSRRQYSSAPSPPKSDTPKMLAITAAAALFGTGVYFITAQQATAPQIHFFATSNPTKTPSPKQSPATPSSSTPTPAPFTPTHADYQAVYDAIAQKLWANDDYDDGSYGPILLRLAWHCSGTYDAATQTGGSNGATMRFAPESNHSANNGLAHARDFLESIKLQFPWLSYGDLWTLAGVCAVQEMQGPAIPWRPGRQDKTDGTTATPDGRLPDGARGADHLRAIFGRMGFSDQEIVALSGAHALGRCHVDRSGFEGPWTFSPTVLTNEYFRLLVEEKWGWKSWEGNKQYEDKSTKSLMMLPSDMALVEDEGFRGWVEKYARDEGGFFEDFKKVCVKLFELGVPFKEGVVGMTFRRLEDGEAEGEAA